MRRSLPFFAALTVLAAAVPAAAATLSVGPGKTYAKPCAAIAAAQPGDIIEVDAAGSYDGDTCAWSTDNLTVRGINGRAKIDLKGASPAQKKGIFTIAAKTATIESFELSGAAISAADGNNGAGIRHQGLNLTVRDCFFHDNQDGILGGPLDNGQPADGQGEVLIERSEFFHNGAGDGFSHNMYINHYGKFTLRSSWSHAALVGHLVKTRAAENYILYNRITGEDGTDSYEIDVPNGGKTYLIGNLIEQGAMSQNPAIVDYAEEGMNAANPLLELFVVNNSFVNDLGKGVFVQVAQSVSTPVVIQNNVFVGAGMVTNQPNAMMTANFNSGDPMFVDQAGYDYHLKAGSPCVDQGQAPGMGDGYALSPDHQYLHPANFEGRTSVGAIDIGAYELGGGSGSGGGASSSSTASGSGTASGTGTGSGGGGGVCCGGGAGGAGGIGGGSSTGSSSGTPGDAGGCGCEVGSESSCGGAGIAFLAAAVWIARRRRRG